MIGRTTKILLVGITIACIASAAVAQGWDWGWQAHEDAQRELFGQRQEEGQRQIERQQDQFRQQRQQEYDEE